VSDSAVLVTHRHVHCMYCDDIREEVNGKSSLIGWHSGPVAEVRSAPPLFIPRIAVMTHVLSPFEQPFKKMALELRWCGKVLQRLEPDDDQMAAMQAAAAQEARVLKAWRLNAAIIVQPFVVDQAGILRVHVFLDGEELIANGLEFRFVHPESNRSKVARMDAVAG
jgi:hypothetical protein